MGWGNCGEDSEGRPIGYYHEGICDEEGCEAKIDRGLAYACGSMHSDDEYGCDKYFCGNHLFFGGPRQMCKGCQDVHAKLPAEECCPDLTRCSIHDEEEMTTLVEGLKEKEICGKP